MEQVLGKRPGIATQTDIRRAPDFKESLADRSTRIADIVRAGIEEDPSDMNKTSFMHAPMNVGRSNPYGDGIDAWEPNTEIFDGYERVYSSSQQAELDAGADPGSLTGTVGGTSPVINADGKVSSMIAAAMGMVGKYYVWGGTTSAGVDCSGLIYYAFNAAGIDMPRYRAVDYRNMGTAVDTAHALPGDLVYIDNPNTDTDHIGIYIGNGQMIQSPHTGARTQISPITDFNVTSIRRVLSDSQLGQMAKAPSSGGGSVPSYAGKIFAPAPTSTSGGSNRWL